MFTGLCAFPLTPLHQQNIDEKAFIRILARLTDAGVDSLGILGSTGSYAYLSREQRRRVVQVAKAHAGSIPMMVGVGAIAGITTVLLVLLYGQARIFFAMSRDGMVPARVCKIHKRYHTPYIVTVMGGIFVSIIAGFVPIGVIAEIILFALAGRMFRVLHSVVDVISSVRIQVNQACAAGAVLTVTFTVSALA